MPKARAQFIGLATFLNEKQNEGAPPSTAYGHRMVLVNAGTQAIEEHPQLAGLTPHIGRVAFRTADLVSIEGPNDFTVYDEYMELVLAGATLRIDNAHDEPLTGNLSCLPQLNDFVPGILPGVASLGHDADAAYAHFELEHGHLAAGVLPTGAGVTEYEVPTHGDPVLRITPFTGSTPATIVTLRHPENDIVDIAVHNAPDDGKDSIQDFLLNFLAGDDQFPKSFSSVPDLTCPNEMKPRFPDYRTADFATVACSNTGLP